MRPLGFVVVPLRYVHVADDGEQPRFGEVVTIAESRQKSRCHARPQQPLLVVLELGTPHGSELPRRLVGQVDLARSECLVERLTESCVSLLEGAGVRSRRTAHEAGPHSQAHARVLGRHLDQLGRQRVCGFVAPRGLERPRSEQTTPQLRSRGVVGICIGGRVVGEPSVVGAGLDATEPSDRAHGVLRRRRVHVGVQNPEQRGQLFPALVQAPSRRHPQRGVSSAVDVRGDAQLLVVLAPIARVGVELRLGELEARLRVRDPGFGERRPQCRTGLVVPHRLDRRRALLTTGAPSILFELPPTGRRESDDGHDEPRRAQPSPPLSGGGLFERRSEGGHRGPSRRSVRVEPAA